MKTLGTVKQSLKEVLCLTVSVLIISVLILNGGLILTLGCFENILQNEKKECKNELANIQSIKMYVSFYYLNFVAWFSAFLKIKSDLDNQCMMTDL